MPIHTENGQKDQTFLSNCTNGNFRYTLFEGKVRTFDLLDNNFWKLKDRDNGLKRSKFGQKSPKVRTKRSKVQKSLCVDGL